MKKSLPSIKTLSRIFNGDAAEARRIMEGDREFVLTYKGAKERAAQCLNPPPLWDLQLHALNIIGNFHGVEAVKVDRHYAEYLNTGETYAETLIYFGDRFRVQSYGDFIEIQERYMPKRRRY